MINWNHKSVRPGHSQTQPAPTPKPGRPPAACSKSVSEEQESETAKLQAAETFTCTKQGQAILSPKDNAQSEPNHVHTWTAPSTGQRKTQLHPIRGTKTLSDIREGN